MKRPRNRAAAARGRALALLTSAAVVSSGLIPCSFASAQSEYHTLTETRRRVTNFNVETIRGLVRDDAQGRLYAINTHGSTLSYFTHASGNFPAATFQTILNPSALALFNEQANGSGRNLAIVVGGGTHGAALHDRDTGAILNFVKLPSEPMDVVIDPGLRRAFISCGGAFDRTIFDPVLMIDRFESGGVVVELNLDTFAIVQQHFIPQARPMFLHFDEGGAGTGDNSVFVTAHLSGNTTTWTPDGPTAIFDQTIVKADPSASFPDEDLFQIDITTGTVTAAASGLGTILTGHGRNPNDGKYWVLGVDSKNADAFSEPEHRGQFAANQFVQMDSALNNPTIGSLDWQATATKPASFPIAIGFRPSTGHAFVTSSTGDVVRVLDKNGNTIRNVTLPDGSIPRSILVSNDEVWVYAWGTNKVFGFSPIDMIYTPNATPVTTLDLGNDPNPEAVRHGREIWYDADRSLDAVDDTLSPPFPVAGKVTCNTCHPRGGMDMLAWNVSDAPLDQKDVMVTQSLLSIEDSFPYHWRGERSLTDFNGAFPGILGGEELNPAELADFEAFVFSLQGAANPRQSLDRRIDDTRFLSSVDLVAPQRPETFQGIPSQGQDDFHFATNALGNFTGATCVQCHGAESGTNGLITADVISVLPTQIQSDVAHLRQLGHKLFQPRYDVTTNGGTLNLRDRPRGGFGLSQDGDDPDLLEFLSAPGPFFVTQTTPVMGFAPPAEMRSSLQQRINTVSFVMQFDEGIAPSAHHAVWFEGSSSLGDVSNMIQQANQRWIDVCVLITTPAPVVEFAMWYDSDASVFRTALPGTVGGFNQTLAQLELLHSFGMSLTFLGVPPGNGFRVAVDQDNDGLPAQLEVVYGTDPRRADSEAPTGSDPFDFGDGFPDGYELDLALAFPGGNVSPLVHNQLADIQGLDTVPPEIQVATLDHATGRISKHFVTFSEPVTYTTVLQRWDGAAWQDAELVQTHSALRTLDTVIAHGMTPTQPTAATPNEYRVLVDMTDLAGIQQKAFLTKLDTLGGVPNPNGTPFEARTTTSFGNPATENRFVTRNVNVQTTPTSGPRVRVQATVDVETVIGTTTNQVTLFQVVWFDPASAEWRIVPRSDLTIVPTSNTRISEFINFGLNHWGSGGPNPQSDPEVPGPFVLAEGISGTPGSALAEFELSSNYAGLTCRVNVLGVLTEITAAPIFEPLGNRQWQMPMSPKAGRFFEFSF